MAAVIWFAEPDIDSTFRRGVVASISCIDDTFLVRDAQRGNAAAFEQLVRLHDRAILKLALRLTGSESDAQDVYQEAFLKAYKNLSSFRFECCFSTWIYRIVTNVFLSHLRRKEVRKESVMVAVVAEGEECELLDQFSDGRTGSDPELAVMSRELGHHIANALKTLTLANAWSLN
jgi:RNA polymerase sigma-70 factor (ECF subfamily)